MTRFTKYLVALALITVVSAGAVYSGSYTYTDSQKRLKAAVLMPAGSTDLPAYTFDVMNMRQDMKPSGWDFYNPFAPASVMKSASAYWTLDISKVNAYDLVQYDILLLPVPAPPASILFTANDREKLRKFVDNGGVLWIDNYGGQLTGSNFFIRELNFSNPTLGGMATNLPLAVPADSLFHSLVNRPFKFSWPDINKLAGFDGTGIGEAKYITNYAVSRIPDEHYFTSIVVGQDITKPIVSAAQYGGGAVVVCAEPISKSIVAPVDYGGTGPNYMRAEPEDLKFAYNIVSLGTVHTTFQKSPRHTGYSLGQIGAPLAKMWSFPGAGVASSPAILDDLVFYVGKSQDTVDTKLYIHAFEISPKRDRDGDGNPDDGLPDPAGAPYDEIWRMDLQDVDASSPTVAYLPTGTGESIPIVFVTLKSGAVAAFEARTGTPAFGAELGGIAVWEFSDGKYIPAPTYADGNLFWADGFGYLHGFNCFARTAWVNPIPTTTPPTIMGAANSPTLGYYYDSGNGATEQVLYLSRLGLGGQVTGGSPGSVVSYPIRVFNETLIVADKSQGLYRTKSGNTTVLNDNATYNLYTMESNKLTPLSGVTLVPNGATPPTFNMFKVAPSSIPENATVVADYVLDYSATSNSRTRSDLSIMLKKDPATGAVDSSVDYAGVVGAPAASKNDILYFGTDNGSLYAMRDKVRGSDASTVEWRWYTAGNEVFGGNTAAPIGSPAVSGDMVYFAVNEDSPTGTGKILAFRADPVFSINVGGPIKRNTGVQVKQIDAMSGRELILSSATEASGATIPQNINFVISYDSGKITFYSFRVGNDDLSCSNDIIVDYIPEGQEQFVSKTVNAAAPAPGDKWNNLVWYKDVGSRITSSPIVMGDILYAGCANGELVSMDVGKINRGRTGTQENLDNPAKPDVLKGMYWSDTVMGDKPIDAAPAGSHGMLAVATADGLTLLNNPVALIADGNRILEMDSGGRVTWACDSTIQVASTIKGVNQLDKATSVPFNRPSVVRRTESTGFVVADTGNNRIVHIDSSGMILWQITDFTDPRDLLPAGMPLTISRPTDVSMWVVTPVGTNYPEYHYLIADRGNYRVVEVAAKRDPVTGNYVNELIWVSPTTLRGKKYEFVSARITPMPNAANTALTQDIVCVAVNQVRVVDEGATPMKEKVFPGGAIIRFKSVNPDGTHNEKDDVSIYDTLPIGGSGSSEKLLKPTFFDRYYRGITGFMDVAISDEKVYVYDLTLGGALPPFTKALYTDEVKDGKPLPFLPSYVQALPSGHILVTNRATIGGDSSDYKGEVVELSYDNGSWEIVGRSGGASGNSHGLRQPASAERKLD